jgi:transaldolase
MTQEQNPLRLIHELGQSFWIDFIDREMLAKKHLDRMIKEDGLRGLTSNPSIFEKAILSTTDYDKNLRKAAIENPDGSSQDWFEQIAIDDIQTASDSLMEVYTSSNKNDGYVSLEVSPLLAKDTSKTIEEARRLWHSVNRPNLMIKIPATEEGFPAIEKLLSEAININVTLIFSLEQYEKTAHSYLRGISNLTQMKNVSSVASFFVSRIDTKVDKVLENINTPQSNELKGKAAIANANQAYRLFNSIFESSEFQILKEKGARPQRLLWGSTSTKNINYPDTLYVDQLIGRDTINTIPPITAEAFKDHGTANITLDPDNDENHAVFVSLEELGVDFNQICSDLLDEGVKAFADSYSSLMTAVETKAFAKETEQ